MNSAPGLIDDRVIFYRHMEASFYSAFPFILGKAISQVPQVLLLLAL